MKTNAVKIVVIALVWLGAARMARAETYGIETLDLSNVEQGWGSPHANKTVDGHGLSIAGRKFEHGLGTHASSTFLSHSSDVKTMEEIFGLSYLSNAIPSGETTALGSGYNNVASVNDLSDLFKPVSVIVVQQPAGATLTNGVSTIVFATVKLGSSVTNLFTVTNSGNAALNLTNVVVTGANAGEFTVSGITLPGSVAAGAAATFKVVFSPTSSGASSATLQITNNDSSHNPFTVTLTGMGFAADRKEHTAELQSLRH